MSQRSAQELRSSPGSHHPDPKPPDQPADSGEDGSQRSTAGRGGVGCVPLVLVAVAAAANEATPSPAGAASVDDFVRGVLGPFVAGTDLSSRPVPNHAAMTEQVRLETDPDDPQDVGAGHGAATTSSAALRLDLYTAVLADSEVLQAMDGQGRAGDVLGALSAAQRKLLADDLLGLSRLARGVGGRSSLW